MNKSIFDPEEYVRNGGYIETVDIKEESVGSKKKKRKKRNLIRQKRFGLLNLLLSLGMILVSKYVPEILFWAFIFLMTGIAGLVSKEEIFYF